MIFTVYKKQRDMGICVSRGNHPYEFIFKKSAIHAKLPQIIFVVDAFVKFIYARFGILRRFKFQKYIPYQRQRRIFIIHILN